MIVRNTEEYTRELEKTVKMLRFNNDTEIRLLHNENNQKQQQIDKALKLIEQILENNKYLYMSTSLDREAIAENELCNKLKQILKGDENENIRD